MIPTDKEAACAQLRKILKPGSVVYTVLRHVSKSGMSRRIDVFVVSKGEPYFWTGSVARAIDARHDYKRGGLVIHGCGMDMGFDVVYRLGCALWPKGNGKFVSGRNGDKGPETDGGYMLRQRWL